jgi:hypothetical protein
LAAHFPNLEMLANVPAFREHIVGRLGEPGADLRRLAAYFAPTWATSRPERHPGPLDRPLVPRAVPGLRRAPGADAAPQAMATPDGAGPRLQA